MGSEAQPDMAHSVLQHSWAGTVNHPSQTCLPAIAFMSTRGGRWCYLAQCKSYTWTGALNWSSKALQLPPIEHSVSAALPAHEYSDPACARSQRSFIPLAVPTATCPQTPSLGNLHPLPHLGAGLGCNVLTQVSCLPHLSFKNNNKRRKEKK